MRPLVLVSRADPASVSIRDALLGMAPWREVGAFHGLPVRVLDRSRGDAAPEHGGTSGDLLMAEVEPLHLECDLVDAQLAKAGFEADVVLVASKHRAESGKPALTVHPIGNWGDADFGGRPRRLVPTAPVVMGRVLRRLHAEAAGLRHAVTLEATHHGPYLETPTMFVEIGTDEAAWRDPDLASRVARALLAATTPSAGDAAPVLVALGGSHYAPRVGDLVKQGRMNVGHIAPAYAFERDLAGEVLYDAIRGTPGCEGYWLDPKTFAAPPEIVDRVFAPLELGWWTEKDLP